MRTTILGLAAALGACTEPAESGDYATGVLTEAGLYRVQAEAIPDPPTSGAATLALHVADPARFETPAVGCTLTVTPWMTSMNHGVMGEVIVTALDGGDYEATWSYPMPGWWDVTVEIDGDAGSDFLVLGYDVQ